MLTQQENERLTQVGKGTPMGELMRRYWHPIAAKAELDDRPTKAVRILGEDLVLYKDRSGTYGLIERLCPHRRVDLSYGIPEEHGLRCMYHGWMYDETGQCVEQPFEETVHPSRVSRPGAEPGSSEAVVKLFKEKVKVAGYPIKEKTGLLFAYLGPLPAPELPEWEPLNYDNAVFEVSMTHLPCNYLQCMENSLDPVHVEWLHRFYTFWQAELPTSILEAIPPRIPHQEISFNTFQHGIIKRRRLEGYTKDHDDWKIGHPVLFPNILFVGAGGMRKTLQYRVPIDDENTLHVTFSAFKYHPNVKAPKQERIPYKYAPVYDEDGQFNVKYTIDQDKMAWATQGRIAQRQFEKLGESDKGIILYRKQLREQVQIVADGGDPINVFRDARAANTMEVPTETFALGYDKVKRLRFYQLEGGTSGIEDLATAAFDSWYSEQAVAKS